MSSYEVTRSTSIAALPGRVFGLVNDFHQWTQWSPWEGLDPDMTRNYGGPNAGVGARYSWKGNRKAGEGSMKITGSGPDGVTIDLEFLKPFKNSCGIRLALAPTAKGTDVTWTMTGETPGGFAGLFTRVVPMDRLVGKDFERGLARLKAVAEQAG
jgi:Polyketide cyclase / dehydrase and lipid transport